MAPLFPQIKAQERCSEHGKSKHIKDLEDTTGVEREMNTYAELTEKVCVAIMCCGSCEENCAVEMPRKCVFI